MPLGTLKIRVVTLVVSNDVEAIVVTSVVSSVVEVLVVSATSSVVEALEVSSSVVEALEVSSDATGFRDVAAALFSVGAGKNTGDARTHSCRLSLVCDLLHSGGSHMKLVLQQAFPDPQKSQNPPA